ncbi:hypothetical protein AK812_SmicGene37775 [Symbiodinium microadriaticum]|uniref:RNase H type-1 domain-containing protein n=1 Tax=Symbiodinium microadriaticum TaxID=2951 RepID=A0A1Q9CFG6_SYMMI|nr:hypothetical protein AK812_SmicGene37775 [Symbiodinium microadriaticum]
MWANGAAKSIWAEDTDGKCPLCGQLQTKHHKILACPSLESVRAPLQPTLQRIIADWPSWVHCPAPTYAPDVEIAQLIFHTRQLPVPTVQFAAWDVPGARGFLRLFTDGSCRYPASSSARHAGFAVVLDATSSDAEVPGALSEWRVTGVPPVTFAVVCQGMVPGEQTINRAELCGVIQAIRAARCQGFDAIEIWTDSQYVINTWNHCSGSMAASNPDLVCILHNLRSDSIQLRKVKSHADLRQLWGMEQWLSLGNAVVDTAARVAVQDDLPLVCDLMDRTAHHEAQQLADLRFFWRYLQDLSKEEYRLLRCRSSTSASEEVQVEEPPTLQCADLPAAWLRLNAGPFQCRQLPDPERAVLLACSWPPWFTIPIWRWIQSLQWNTEPRSGRCHTGSAYVELLVDFIVSTGVSPPDSLEAAAEVPEPPLQWMRPCTVRQWVCNLVEAVRQLERLAHVNLWGPRRHKVFALRSLGVKEARHGLAQRPKFVQEEIVFDLLCSTVQRNDLEPLRVFLRQYTGPWYHSTAVQKAWRSTSATERVALSKSLRNTRRRGHA